MVTVRVSKVLRVRVKGSLVLAAEVTRLAYRHNSHFQCYWCGIYCRKRAVLYQYSTGFRTRASGAERLQA